MRFLSEGMRRPNFIHERSRIHTHSQRTFGCTDQEGKEDWISNEVSGARGTTFYTLISKCHRQGLDATASPPKAWAAEQAKIRQALAQTAGVPMSIERLSRIGLRGLGFTDTNIHHEHVI
jgi:hypothetical protein